MADHQLCIFYINCVVSVKHFPRRVPRALHNNRFRDPGLPYIGVERVPEIQNFAFTHAGQ